MEILSSLIRIRTRYRSLSVFRSQIPCMFLGTLSHNDTVDSRQAIHYFLIS